MPKPTCSTPDCARTSNKEGLCDHHREQARADMGLLCAHTSCGRGAIKAGYCGTHYAQHRKGVTLSDLGDRRAFYRDLSGETAHGTSARYRQGCRCTPCREIKSSDNKKHADTYRSKNDGANPTNAWRQRYRDEHGIWPQRSGGDFITPTKRTEIYTRDKWTCQLCDTPVEPGASSNSPKYPTLDHIIPQSWGTPDHSEGNLQTAHRGCNAKKGNRVQGYAAV